MLYNSMDEERFDIEQGYTRDACGSPAAVSPNVSSSGLAFRPDMSQFPGPTLEGGGVR